MSGPFADVLAANADYAESFPLRGLASDAGKGLAVVTCMDTRIDPLAVLGLQPGDAKILRNAGARVTDAVLRDLVLAVHLLGVQRVLVLPHTRCRMTQPSDDAVHDMIRDKAGVDTRGLEFGTTPNQEATLREDLARISTHPLLPPNLQVGGARYDVDTGRVTLLTS